MWIWLLCIQLALAAWPDSFEHRIAAMEALRYDLAMPGIPHNKAKILSKYQIACDKGYFDVCHPEEWVGDEHRQPTLPIRKRSAINRRARCNVVVGMQMAWSMKRSL